MPVFQPSFEHAESVLLREPADDSRSRLELAHALTAARKIAETEATRDLFLVELRAERAALRDARRDLTDVRMELAEEKRFTHELCARYHLVRIWNQLLVAASGVPGTFGSLSSGFIRSGAGNHPLPDDFSFVTVLTHHGVTATRARALQPADLAVFEAAIAANVQLRTATAHQLRRGDYGTEAAFLALLGPDLEPLYRIVAEMRGSNDPTVVVGGMGGITWR
jgi:hypothetical protein